jgi:hypothetical protein
MASLLIASANGSAQALSMLIDTLHPHVDQDVSDAMLGLALGSTYLFNRVLPESNQAAPGGFPMMPLPPYMPIMPDAHETQDTPMISLYRLFEHLLVPKTYWRCLEGMVYLALRDCRRPEAIRGIRGFATQFDVDENFILGVVGVILGNHELLEPGLPQLAQVFFPGKSLAELKGTAEGAPTGKGSIEVSALKDIVLALHGDYISLGKLAGRLLPDGIPDTTTGGVPIAQLPQSPTAKGEKRLSPAETIAEIASGNESTEAEVLQMMQMLEITNREAALGLYGIATGKCSHFCTMSLFSA